VGLAPRAGSGYDLPMASPSRCPCGSGNTYRECCAPLHEGAREAADCATLMRSRYAAFVLKKIDYLYRTLHTDHDDRSLPEAEVRAAILSTAEACRFLGLWVLESRAPDRKGIGRVLFVARVFLEGKNRSFAELSDFSKQGGGWRYLSGVTVPIENAAMLPFPPNIDGFITYAARLAGT
jgi:SEC-C motif domain protein